MISFETILTFFSASLMLAFVPGPDNLFVLTQATLHGWRVGLAVTLGLCTGLVVHTSAAALGVSVIFRQSEMAFTILKLIGAAYLLYLGYCAFRSGRVTMREGGKARHGRMYFRGILMNVTNPKVAIFFLAFLPQFISERAGGIPFQAAVLGALFILATLVAFSTISLLAGPISQRFLQSDRAQAYLNKAAGMVFISLAAKLAVAHR
jgi:threonine/homoserine/homoserine lactone efflux protein